MRKKVTHKRKRVAGERKRMADFPPLSKKKIIETAEMYAGLPSMAPLIDAYQRHMGNGPILSIIGLAKGVRRELKMFYIRYFALLSLLSFVFTALFVKVPREPFFILTGVSTLALLLFAGRAYGIWRSLRNQYRYQLIILYRFIQDVNHLNLPINVLSQDSLRDELRKRRTMLFQQLPHYSDVPSVNWYKGVSDVAGDFSRYQDLARSFGVN